MDTTVPAVEIANDADPLGIGRPDRTGGASNPIPGHRVGAQDLIDVVVAAFPEEVKVKIRQERVEGVGVDMGLGLAAFIGPLNAVVHRDGISEGRARFKEIRPGNSGEFRAIVPNSSAFGLRQKDPETFLAFLTVSPQNLKGVMMAGLKDAGQARLEGRSLGNLGVWGILRVHFEKPLGLE